MEQLTDAFGRKFSYLRLSLTSLCNFRCQYCLPNGNIFTPGCKSPLNLSEIRNLVLGFSDLGVSKIRLTGGEPSLRDDLIDIIGAVAETPGVETIALTTNGFKLADDFQKYFNAGFPPAHFRTGFVLRSPKRTLELHFERRKSIRPKSH